MPAGDPFGDVMNGIAKYVVSTTLNSASAWRNSTLISGNVVEAVRTQATARQKHPHRRQQRAGSHAHSRRLVDEYALHVYPLVLGGGKRLFPDGKRVNLNLIESQALPTGVVFQRYRTVK